MTSTAIRDNGDRVDQVVVVTNSDSKLSSQTEQLSVFVPVPDRDEDRQLTVMTPYGGPMSAVTTADVGDDW